MEDLTGKQLGQYRIVAPLGEGGMAAVYKAYQPGGEMLYEMATGRPPFAAETPMAILFKHIHDPLPTPRCARRG